MATRFDIPNPPPFILPHQHSWWNYCLTQQWKCSLVPIPHAASSEKRSGEQSQISWAYYPKAVKTNEILRSVITATFITVKFVHLHLSIWPSSFCKPFIVECLGRSACYQNIEFFLGTHPRCIKGCLLSYTQFLHANRWKSSYHLLSTGNMQLIPKYVMYYTVNNISINLISHLYPSP